MIGNYLQANGLVSVVEKCHCGGELYQPDIRLLIMIIKLIDYFTLKLGQRPTRAFSPHTRTPMGLLLTGIPTLPISPVHIVA